MNDVFLSARISEEKIETLKGPILKLRWKQKKEDKAPIRIKTEGVKIVPIPRNLQKKTPPFNYLTNEAREKRIKKGLCFNCDEK